MSVQITDGDVYRVEELTHGRNPGSKAAIVSPFADLWAKYVVPAGIAETPEEVGHFVSQIAHETDHFKTLEEYASGAAYNGRGDLGNTQPGDGPRFKGRGYIQLTGRANYTAAAERTGLDLVGHPESVSEDPEVALICAVDYWLWRVHDLPAVRSNHVADVEAVTRAVNGGMNGFEDRLAHFRSCGIVWPMGGAAAPPAAPTAPTEHIPTEKLASARAALLQLMGDATAMRDKANEMINTAYKAIQDIDA